MASSGNGKCNNNNNNPDGKKVEFPGDTFEPIFTKGGKSWGTSQLENLKEDEADEEEWFTDEHKIPLKRLLDRYGSNMTKGLDPGQVSHNRLKYGTNDMGQNGTFRFSSIIGILRHFFLGLHAPLLLCAILTLITTGMMGIFDTGNPNYNQLLLFGIVFLVACLLSGLSFYYQEYQTTRVMTSFNHMIYQHFAMVKRGGHFIEVFMEDLVVGDIVKLTYGDVIPADIRLINCHEFYVDNSSLTGESDPKRRASICTNIDPMLTKNIVFYSTHAVEGHAKGVVIAVGPNTVMGRIIKLARSEELKKAAAANKSPVVKEIEEFTTQTAIRALIIALGFLGVAFWFQFPWPDAVLTFILILIVIVPENLNLLCTVLLLLMAKRMTGIYCLVKNLHSLETLSSSSVIIVDKTGTLTQNRMNVAHLWFNDRFAEADTTDYVGQDRRITMEPSSGDIGDKEASSTPSFNKLDPGFRALSKVARLCSRAKFKPNQGDTPIFRREVSGDASDGAILRFMESQYKHVRKYRSQFKILCEVPFNSRTKYQAFVHQSLETHRPLETEQKRHFLTLKGAPEEVLKLCDTILVGESEYELTPERCNRVHEVIHALGSLGERVIGFADCHLPMETYNSSYTYTAEKPEFLNAGLRFVGVMSLIDPPRAAVPDTIRKCRNAGVKVVMVTGDLPATAIAIARVVGIISEGNETIEELCERKRAPANQINSALVNVVVITGLELKRMDVETLESLISSGKELIFSRTTPEQKFMIVDTFQRLGNVVAVVGDGVNDAPCIKKADVGIVMGLTGTEVSKAVADMVLMDDNFSSIVAGIQEGRKGFENIKKILGFTLADNMAEMFCYCLCVMLNLPPPLGITTILLTVLGTDLPLAVSLMYEPLESKQIMRLKPRKPSEEKLVTKRILVHSYLHVGMVEAFAGLFSYFVTMAHNGFLPWHLMGIRNRWRNSEIPDMEDMWGQEWTYSSRKRLEAHAQTAFFMTLVVMQVTNLVICKISRKPHVSYKRQKIPMKIIWTTLLAISASLALCCMVMYVHRLSAFFQMLPLRRTDWLLPLPFAILLVLLEGGRQLYLRSADKDGTFYNMLVY